jgi:hypothetical protein
MKKWLAILVVTVLTGAVALVSAQTVEKSSEVFQLNMKKKTEEPVQPVKEQKTRTNEYSVATDIKMVKKKETEEAPESTEETGFSWISPAFTTVRTSEDSYPIRATVNLNENINFVNLFSNGKFVKNIMQPVASKQMLIEDEMPLTLGANQIKVQVVGKSGKKKESELEIIYDISVANYFALVIAVQDYDDPNINDLDHPIRDAARFIDIIQSEYNFKKENVQFMKNPTKADIIGKLHSMRSQVGPEDNLLIYYAGHGLWDEEMQTGYWLPKNASRDNPVDWLPNTDLTNYLNVLKTKHTLLIADACFSGGIFKSRSAFNNILAVEKLYKLTSRKAITSGSLSEVPDKSVFIEYLIKRLDENNKKYLPAEQLYSSMKDAVMNNSGNVPQYGTIQNVGDEGGDFIFIRND